MAQGGCAPAETPDMVEEFRFLLCERCHQEVRSPKLLPCFHNLCTECLQETKSVGCCPICRGPVFQTGDGSIQENGLFANLQTKLSIFKIIKSGRNLVCDNCQKEGMYWCSNCHEFLCVTCFDTHQRYLKRESHEVKPVKDLQADSSKEFFSEFKNAAVMFCSNEEHKMQSLSIYCKVCKQSMCCVCAVLDSRHNGHHCHIREEIQRRQGELLTMSTELKEKTTYYDRTCNNLQELVNNMVEVKNETRQLIQQKVAEMVRLVHETGEKLLATVDDQHHCQVQDLEKKLKNVESMVQRMESCKQLVEKMQLYASDQEMMDMFPFIRGSLEELRRKQLPIVETQMQVENFAKVKTELQAFYERVMKEKEPVPAIVNVASRQESFGKLQAKRQINPVENTLKIPIKVIKIEASDDGWRPSPGQVDLEQPGTSFGEHPAGNEGILWSEDTEITFKPWLPSISSESSETEVSSCLNSCPDDASSDDAESVDSSLQEGIQSEQSQDDFLRNVFTQPKELFSGQGALVFFELKVLSGRIIQLVSVVDESNSFSVMIQPLQSFPIAEMRGGLCESGLESFLRYLQTLYQPILVGYDLWSMDFPFLVKALKALRKDEAFKASLFGFLDILPIIKEKFPDLASYNLKSLDHTYLRGQLDDSRAIDCARTVKDLCTVLDINPAMERRPVITYSSLQCYSSLQPLVTEKLLTRSSIQTLALHNVCLAALQSVYRKDPEHGLKRFSRYLNSRMIIGTKKIQQLSKVGKYFQNLMSAAAARSGAHP